MSARDPIPRRNLAGFGVIAALLAIGLTSVVIAYGNGHYDDGYRLAAVFPSSSQGLFTDGGTDVKLRGVNVGTVDGIEVLPDGRARMTLFMDPGVRVPRSVSASIEPLSIFGPKFIRLTPGELDGTGPYLSSGDTITDTRSGAELTRIIDETADLLGSFDPGRVLAITDAVGDATIGMGEEIGSTIDSAAVLAEVGARHTDELSLFLADLASLSGTLADHSGSIVALISQANDLLATTNPHVDDIDHLLEVTGDISTAFSGLLERHRLDFDSTVRAIADFVHGVYGSADRLPDSLDLIGTFFGRYSDIIRFDGPPGSGKQMAGLRGFLSLDLCLLAGICPDGQP